MRACVRCQTTFPPPSWECPQCGFAPESNNGYLRFAPEFAAIAGDVSRRLREGMEA